MKNYKIKLSKKMKYKDTVLERTVSVDANAMIIAVEATRGLTRDGWTFEPEDVLETDENGVVRTGREIIDAYNAKIEAEKPKVEKPEVLERNKEIGRQMVGAYLANDKRRFDKKIGLSV